MKTTNIHAFASVIRSALLNQLRSEVPTVRWEIGNRRNEAALGLHLSDLPAVYDAIATAERALEAGFEVIYIH